MTGDGASPNVALTDSEAVSVTAHEAIPEHAPDQPTNVMPGPGAAVSVTCVPWSKPAVHTTPQLMPAGALVTVPMPAPDLVTVSVR